MVNASLDIYTYKLKICVHKNDDLGEIISRSGGFNQSTHECS